APLHFFLVYDVMRTSYPNGMLGLVSATFALPSLLGLIVLLKRTPAQSPTRNAQLALFGGAALFFITLIFPIQFDRQWITLGWALEGAALCWLFHRVPHPALRLVGTALLVTAFVRLALNPAVLSYHARSATPIINWYLYTYGIVTICLFAAARLLPPVRYASLGLLGVTVLKLFLHDLSQLDQLYRIAAFVVVAIIAILASFLYQRFLGLSAKQTQ